MRCRMDTEVHAGTGGLADNSPACGQVRSGRPLLRVRAGTQRLQDGIPVPTKGCEPLVSTTGAARALRRGVVPPEEVLAGRRPCNNEYGGSESEFAQHRPGVFEHACVSVVEGEACRSPHGLPGDEAVQECAEGEDVVMGHEPAHLAAESVNRHVEARVARLRGIGWRDDVVVAEDNACVATASGQGRKGNGVQTPISQKR